MKPLSRLIIALLLIPLFILPSQLCLAWSEGGHHLIAAVAFSLLTENERAELLAVLKEHPALPRTWFPQKTFPMTRSGSASLSGALVTSPMLLASNRFIIGRPGTMNSGHP